MRFTSSGPPTEKVMKDLSGRVVIITGASAGLGKECLRQFALMKPARLILAVRSIPRGEAAMKEVEALTGCKTMEVWEVDLASFSSVKAFGKRVLAQLDRLDIFLENAGLGGLKYKTTGDGYCVQTQVNAISTYWLGEMLLPLLQATAKLPNPPSANTQMKPHLCIVGSWMHYLVKATVRGEAKPITAMNSEKRFKEEGRYELTKLFSLYIGQELAKIAGPDVVVNVANPGACAHTEFTKDLGLVYKVLGAISKPFGRTLERACTPLVWSCLNETTPGAFISNCEETEISDFALSSESDLFRTRVIEELRQIVMEQDKKSL
ncbi:NAD(P)-binding protein [Atractiella rhizophila]|nr:NAD(P)-binding protein [Atractiella rhizophila]